MHAERSVVVIGRSFLRPHPSMNAEKRIHTGDSPHLRSSDDIRNHRFFETVMDLVLRDANHIL